jgi:hypothetical protein
MQLNLWQKKLNNLSKGKISWEYFLGKFEMQNHPALLLSTTKAEQSLLHIAVYQNNEEVVSQLAHLLAMKKNSYGLTALHVAKFLGRANCARLLGLFPLALLSDVSHVVIESPEKMEQLQQFAYHEEPIFESANVLNLLLEKTLAAKSSDQIPGEKIWMGIYFNREVQPKVSLRWIDETLGFGIFAQQTIPSCSFISEYAGIVKDLGDRSTKDNYYCVRYTSWGIKHHKLVVDAQSSGNFTRFINHSETPNLRLQSIYWNGLPRMVLISLQEIEAGTQLTFDYGSLFWKECPHVPIPIQSL